VSIKVSLNDVPLSALSVVTWRLTGGTQPEQQVFMFDHSTGANLVKVDVNKEVTLKIQDGNIVKSFKRLNILRAMPGDSPLTRGVLVSDRRWRLSRKHIYRRYNIRRRTGDRRMSDPSTFQSVVTLVDDEAYAPYSINPPFSINGRRWTARAVLEDVLEELDPGNWKIIANITEQSPIENLELDDLGDAALNRILSYLPGIGIYMDAEGELTVYHTRNQGEVDAVETSGPEQAMGPHAEWIDNRSIRPKKLRLLFSPEYEIRIDSLIEGDTFRADVPERLMSNVLPIPDPILTVGDRQVVMGTWRGAAAVIAAWNADRLSGSSEPLTIKAIRENWFFGIWSHYTELGKLDIDRNWTTRIGTLRQHFRTTYQIHRPLIDMLASFRVERVAIVDEEGGRYARSPVLTDYCIVPEEMAKVRLTDALFLGLNIEGYPGGPTVPLSEGISAPATLQIVDMDQGIIHISYALDPLGRLNTIIPSLVDNLPTADISNPTEPAAWDLTLLDKPGQGRPTLSVNHSVATVITAAPAAPNSSAQLYAVERTPEDVARFIQGDVSDAQGPTQDIRIRAGMETARFAWDDSRAQDIEIAIGLRPGRDDGATSTVNDLLVNRETIEAIADAVAARYYATTVNRYMGGKMVRFKPDIEPRGNISAVTHTVGQDGTAHTTLTLPQELQEVDFIALLPASVRRRIFREVQP